MHGKREPLSDFGAVGCVGSDDQPTAHKALTSAGAML